MEAAVPAAFKSGSARVSRAWSRRPAETNFVFGGQGNVLFPQVPAHQTSSFTESSPTPNVTPDLPRKGKAAAMANLDITSQRYGSYNRCRRAIGILGRARVLVWASRPHELCL